MSTIFYKASITALAILATALGSSAVCTNVAPDLVGWWQAENNGVDAINGNTAYSSNGVSFAAGEVGQAFNLNGSAYLRINAAASLDVGQSNGLTIECWIKPADLSTARPLVEFDDGYNLGVHLWINEPYFNNQGGTGSVFANIIDTAGGTHALVSVPGLLTTSSFQHVAVTYDKASGLGVLYLNGNVVYSYNLGTFTPETAFDLYFGIRVSPQYPSVYPGLMDEVSLYSRALGQAEIQAIVDAGTGGKCVTPTPPLIVTQPQSQTVGAGGSVTFSVTPSGTPPLSYQWRFNGTNRAGATGSSLTITNLQVSQGGNYSVQVTNANGYVLSSNALLTVTTVSNSCVAISSLAGWWRAENNGVDSINGNTGYLSNGVSFAAGEVGQAFNFNGSDYVRVNAATTLDIGQSNGLTIECWIKPSDLNDIQPLVQFDDGYNLGVHLLINQPYFNNQGGPGSLFANITDTSGATHALVSLPGLLNSNTFQHVAVTYDKSSGQGMLYLNGNVVYSYNLGTFTPETAYNLYLGVRVSPQYPSIYQGLMDEVSLYSRALSQAEIQAIAGAGTSGKCVAPSAPHILTQPQSQTVAVGGGAAFTVAASGAPPLSYQWRFNGTNQAGATGSSLTLTNVQSSQGGNYSVQVSNADGLVLSSNALLTVTGVSNACVTVSNLVSWWRAEGNASDSIDSNSGTANTGVTFVLGKVGQTFGFNGTSGFVQVPDAPNLRFTNAVTIEAWIYPHVTGGHVQELVSKWEGGPHSYTLKILPSGQVNLGISSDGAENIADAISSDTVPTNQWTHIAAEYDGVSMKLFFNGVLENTTPWSQGIFPGSAPLIIGSTFSSGSFFDGLIDEPSIYNRALTTSEIQAIVNAGGIGKCTPSNNNPPLIVSQPTNQSVVIGGSASFSASAVGTAPLSYQWSFNGTNVAGATNTVLSLSNVQPSQAGNYWVVVSNLFGTALSSNALLTVTSAPSGCVSAPAGIVSWWRAESNAVDSVDGNSGGLSNGVTFAAGEVGQAFSFNGTSAFIQVPDAPNLRFTNALTIEAWIYPHVTSGQVREIVSKWDGGPHSFTLKVLPSGQINLGISSDGADNTADVISLNTVPINQWTHVAAEYDGTSMKLFLNGTLDNTTPWTQGIFPGFSAPLIIGSTAGSGSFFNGLLDEPSVYNRALTAAEIQAIASAGGNGKCAPSNNPPVVVSQPSNRTVAVGGSATFSVAATGTAPLRYQWRFNGTNVAGATNTLLSLTNIQLSQAGNYGVMVTNLFGAALSSNALLTVTSAPSGCVSAPAGLVSWWPGEGSAADVMDGNSGTLLNGASITNGFVGQAFNLNGSSASIQVPDAPNLRFTTAMTFETWIYPRTIGGQYHEIMSKWEGGVNQRSYIVDLGPDGRAELAVNGDGVNNTASAFSLGAVSPNHWVHIAGTYDGANVKLYLNGVLQNSTPWTQGIFPGTAPMIIGSTLESGSFFDGLIDEPTVYNRALSQSELQAIYNAGTAGKCATIPPTIVTQPQSQAVGVGGGVTFTVTASGTPPLNYQWRFNGTNRAGATTSSLTLTNLQPSQGGNYSVQVTNVNGSALSSNALLTVTTPSNACVTISNLVSWWRAEGNAADAIDGNSGALLNGASITNGFVGQAFNLNGSSAYIQVPDAPNLRFTTAMTFEAWIYPRTIGGQYHEIMSKWEGGVNQHSYLVTVVPDGRVAFGVCSDGINNLANAFSLNTVTTSHWTHVAGVYDGATVKLYFDGVLQTSTPWTQGIFPGSAPLIIGSTLSSGSFFDGMIDEPSVYNRALSQSEVQAIYNAGTAGKCAGIPPTIATQPQSQTVGTGGTVTFTVTASGTPPLNYQWRFNGTNRAGATGSSLTITNVQPSQGGNYSVQVTNVNGSVLSSNALLTVTTVSNACVTISNLVSWWPAEGNAADVVDGNSGTLLNGASITNGFVGQAFNLNGTSAYIQIPDAPNLRFTTAMTFEAWLYPRSIGGQYREISSKWDGGVDQRSFVVDFGPDGKAEFAVTSDGGGNNIASAFSLSAVSPNQWIHIAGTYDGTAVKLYLDGTLQSSTPWTQGIFPGTAPLSIGSALVAGSFFDGLIDEPSVYNRALSQSEVQAIYNAGTTGKCAPIPPAISIQPQSQTVATGGSVTFTVTASGTPPLSYQWRFNGTNRAGATGSSLTITNVQPSQGGNYSVQVTNATGSILSSNALLTVTTVSNTCVTISNLVSWWRAENNAADSVDGNSGTLLNGASITNGFVGQAFNLNGTSAYIQVPDAPNLRFTTAMTFEAWIYPRSIGGQYREISSKWDGGVDQRSFVVDLGPDGRAEFAVNSDGGVNNIASAFSLSAVSPNHWIHIAGTYDGVAVKLYLDGTLQSSTPWTQGIFPGTAPLIIGATLSSGSFFDGLIDEPSVYNRALSQSEVQAIYNSGTAGKCAPIPPAISIQPQSQTVATGSNVTFTVTASGTPPLSYQWRFNGTNRAGATGSSLTITNVQPSQGGNYSVQVTNVNGSVLSSNALLTVTTPSNACVTISNLVSWWPAEGNAADVVDGNSGTLLNGASITNGFVGQAFNLNGTSAYIQVPDAPNLRFTNAMTFEAWIYPRSVGGQYREISSKWDGGFDQRSFVVDLGPDGRAEFAVNSDGGVNNIASAFSLSAVSPNHWIHIAGTYDGVAVKLYLDGALQSSTPWTQGVFPGTAPLSIGSALESGSFFDGLIDEPSVYNRALSQSEVQAIYNAGTTGKCPNHPPIARDVSAATIQNKPMSIPLDKFLALASDPDNNSLTVSSVTPASTNGGTVAISSGSLIYSPVSNYFGADRFTYTISDGHGGTASAFVFVQVRSSALPSGNLLPPTTLSNGFKVNFLGVPGYNYTLQRATNVSGPWITIGTALAGPSGFGTFPDTNAPPASAFYRTVYP